MGHLAISAEIHGINISLYRFGRTLAGALLSLIVHTGSQAAVTIHLEQRGLSELFFNASHAALWFG